MGMIRLAFTPCFIVYTLSVLLIAALLLTVLAYPPAIDLAAVPLTVFAGCTRCCAIIRSRPICAFCSNRYDPRCVNISSKTRRTAGRSAGTSGQWPISAPRWCWTSVRSGRSTTSMRKDWPHLGRGDAPRIPQKSESQGSRHKNAISGSQESCECDSELALLFSLSSAFAILSIFAAAANGCLQKGDLHRSVGRHQFPHRGAGRQPAKRERRHRECAGRCSDS